MSDQSELKQVKVLVLSIHQEIGEAFIKDVCGAGNQATIGGHRVILDVLAGDPRLNAAWDDTVRSAEGILLLTRFLDVISLDKIKAMYRRLPSDRSIPILVLVVREEGESDFKMSCPVCGQKLWVRDADVGKRGRCPNCKKAYVLPDQVQHVRGQLALPDVIEVARVSSGNGKSARSAVEGVLKFMSEGLIEQDSGLDPEVLKQSTIRVQISPDDI